VNSWAKHPLRVAGRLLWLGGEVILAAVNYARWRAFSNPAAQPMARATWLQKSSRRVLRIFGTKTSVLGPIPRSGLLVCNHLSYLDILVVAALGPSRFVAKSEVKRWPVFGWFARLAGTIFVDRNKRVQAARSTEELTSALGEGTLVVLFPEGTSSGGETVLPFKSSLLEPVAKNLHALTAGSISYGLDDGNVSDEVCYWKDMTLVPHLINLLSKRRVHAKLHFAKTPQQTTNRKVLARQLHSQVVCLKAGIYRSVDSSESTRHGNASCRKRPRILARAGV
jgi:1-acyl-sn-glycerol-3-phosphate acyltransferase